jgi:alkanesulfonate monooxygenase SsuD/methylene tetrahydromethanopterin reductase-like flavin-dependent oxidoreductase (luciferase family)
MPRLIFSIALDAASVRRSFTGTRDQRLDLLTAGGWLELVAQAERGLVDFVTIADSHRLTAAPPNGSATGTDQPTGRLDAIMVACRIAPATHSVGIMPMASATLTEPFLLSVQIATLDHVSRGRGGWQLDVATAPGDAAYVSPRGVLPADALHREAADHVEVVRRLWDSWDNDAEIRDTATNRFIDRERIHHIDFEGAVFSVKGPSITPRSPQGQPIIVAVVDSDATQALALAAADVVIVAAAGELELRNRVTALRAAASHADRPAQDIRILADVDVA